MKNGNFIRGLKCRECSRTYGLFDGKDRTLAQVGEQLQISRERVRQIETEALRKLRYSARQHYWNDTCLLDFLPAHHSQASLNAVIADGVIATVTFDVTPEATSGTKVR